MNKNSESEIRWEKTYMFRRQYELTSGGKKTAVLKRKSIFSAKADGEIRDSKFFFDPTGSFNQTLKIRKSGNGEKIGKIDLKWFGNNNGELELSSGKKYIWKCMDFFRGKWSWIDGSGNEIVKFEPEGLMNKNGTIIQNGENSSIEDKDLLTLLGLHLKLFFNYWIIIAVVVIIGILRD